MLPLLLLLACPPPTEDVAVEEPAAVQPPQPEVTLADPPPGPPQGTADPRQTEDLLGDQDARFRELQEALEKTDQQAEPVTTPSEP